jgi:ribonuclease HII
MPKDEVSVKVAKKTRIIAPPLKSRFNEADHINEIGVDEVGRGPLFGRVYTAAVILPKTNFKFELMKDSKKFTSKNKIQEVAEYIKENAIAYSIEYQDEKSVDVNNIRIATFMAMHNAISNIQKTHAGNKEHYYLLIDGCDFKPVTYLNESNMLQQLNHVCIEGGDNKYCAIAAASILAKVARDKYISDLCEAHPKLDLYYSLASNKGYGAKKHLDGIHEYGITRWHRKTFGSCKTSFENSEF